MIYVARASYCHPGTLEISRPTAQGATAEEAEQALRDKLEATNTAFHAGRVHSDSTLHQLLDLWMTSFISARPTLRDGTKRYYKGTVIPKLERILGSDRRLSTLTPDLLDWAFNAMLFGDKSSNVEATPSIAPNAYGLVMRAIEWGQARGAITNDIGFRAGVFRPAYRPKWKDEENERGGAPITWSMEQVTALRAALQAHTVSCLNAKQNGYYERHAPLLDRIADTVAIQYSAALRAGEAWALTRDAVQWSEADGCYWLTIRHSLTHAAHAKGKKSRLGKTKTIESVRRLPALGYANDVFARLLAETEGMPGDTPLIRRVLKGGRDLFVNQDSVYTALARFRQQSSAAADVGMSDFRLHQIRKSSATLIADLYGWAAAQGYLGHVERSRVSDDYIGTTRTVPIAWLPAIVAHKQYQDEHPEDDFWADPDAAVEDAAARRAA
jgi:hypothetical protein